MANEPLYRIVHTSMIDDGSLYVMQGGTYQGRLVPVEPEADELCPNHKSAYLFNFKTWKSYCAHCGEEVERVSVATEPITETVYLDDGKGV